MSWSTIGAIGSTHCALYCSHHSPLFHVIIGVDRDMIVIVPYYKVFVIVKRVMRMYCMCVRAQGGFCDVAHLMQSYFYIKLMRKEIL